MLCPDSICTGCGVCGTVCPADAILMVKDSAGRIAPSVDVSKCRNCGMCDRLCHVVSPPIPASDQEPQVFAGIAKDANVLGRSSSGGAFAVLAKQCLAEGGVVCGAAYDPFPFVKHILVTSEDDLVRIQGSKYVNSEFAQILSPIKALLATGRPLLFGGLPCQVAAVKKYLGDQAERVVLVDLVCHGAPPAEVFNRFVSYLQWLTGEKIIDYAFRGDKKRDGWGGYQSAYATTFKGSAPFYTRQCDNWYLNHYLSAHTYRACCYACRHSRIPRVGDLTIGDFWGIGNEKPFMRDRRNGVSLVLVNSDKGIHVLNKVGSQLHIEQRALSEALSENPNLIRATIRPFLSRVIVWYLMNTPFLVLRGAERSRIFIADIKIAIRFRIRKYVQRLMWCIKGKERS